MRRLGRILFRTLSLVVLVSFVTLLLPFPAVADVQARMAPPWRTPPPSTTNACVPPAMLEAAWRDAVILAERRDHRNPAGEDIARQLKRAHSNGSLPFADTAGCPQLVFDPFTAMAIVGVAALTITLILWAIAMLGST
jgi:hypothetical protein